LSQRKSLLTPKQFAAAAIFRGLFTLIGTAVLSAGCATTLYYKPTATSGEITEQSYGCPGPKNVLQFSPSDISWVHLRVYVSATTASLPGTRLHIEFHTQIGLGVNDIKSDEFQRRAHRTFKLTTDSSRIVLIGSDGKQSVLTSQLLSGTTILQSTHRNIDLGSETLEISEAPIDEFSIQLPTIYIDGSKIEVPLISFKLVKGTYEWTLNC